MLEADAVELVERTPLEGLKDISADVVYRHVDFLARELPGPLDLYQRWERQQWSASALDFSLDRDQWAKLSPQVHEQLEGTFRGFFFGERAVTNTLATLVHAAPAEPDRLFLATQLVDEARHAYFFDRFFKEALGIEDAFGEPDDIDPAEPDDYGIIFDPERGELARATEAVRWDPADYATGVQSVTVYHIMIEGILALTGQRLILRILRNNDLLPAFRAGFTAVTRDESRHVSYGIWALRQAVQRGREGDVRAAVDRTLGPCMRVYANPQVKLLDPRDLPPGSRVDPRDNWGFAVDSVTKRLRTAGVGAAYLEEVGRRAWTHVRESVERYQQLHGEEHPVRLWERGEVQAASAAG